MNFGERLEAAMREHGPLCVGIDPHPGLLASWKLRDDAHGLREFALTVVDAVAGSVAAIKPQSAFFERHGAAGIAVLEEVLGAIEGSGSQVILDAKRGDIGSTMAGYADAYLRHDSPLAVDALTLSPYLGPQSLAPATTAALENDRGAFVLCLTSNPDGSVVQHAGTPSVAAQVASWVAEVNADTATGEMGSVGLVVGATVGDAVERLGIDLEAVGGPLLAPGVGAQGAGSAELRQVFGSARHRVLAATSRAVLEHGPTIVGLRREVKQMAAEVDAALA
jgi:orotidine-5'-phosphate decarboxylase